MKFEYDMLNYVKDHTYKNNIFRFDPTLEIPEGDESGKSLKEIYGMSDNEVESIILDEKWTQIRKIRNELLKETDWVSGEDVPQTIKNKHFPYRQSLRDVTNIANPDDVVFPEIGE